MCFVCWLSKRVCACAEEVGEGSLCNLKGKYKAHKAGSTGRQAGRQAAGKAKEGKGCRNLLSWLTP